MNSARLREVVDRMTERPWGVTNGGRLVVDRTEHPVAMLYNPSANLAAIADLANHATALVDLVAACERYLRGCDSEHPDLMAITQDDFRAALRAVHQIGADHE